jgi:hypothetical protein
MSKTNYLQAVISDLQRTAGPYRCAKKLSAEAGASPINLIDISAVLLRYSG